MTKFSFHDQTSWGLKFSMGAPKGSNNARAFHEKNTRDTIDAIKAALKTISKRGVVFRNVGTLATDVAVRTGQSAGNLRRNKVYREMLAKHLALQRGTAGIVSDHISDVQILKAKLITAQLDASAARKNAERLQRFIDNKDASHSFRNTIKVQDRKPAADDTLKQAFECTAHALDLVLQTAE